MASSSPATGSKGTNVKNSILAALAATLAVAVVVTIVFIVLSPSRVQFSITQASSQQSNTRAVRISVTLTVANPSRRATVTYQSMFVNLINSTEPHQLNYVSCATLPEGAMPLQQPTRNATAIAATVSLVAGGGLDHFTRNTTFNFSVTIATVARFKVGFASTRLYDIEVTCGNLRFLAPGAGRNTTTAQAVGLPITCA